METPKADGLRKQAWSLQHISTSSKDFRSAESKREREKQLREDQFCLQIRKGILSAMCWPSLLHQMGLFWRIWQSGSCKVSIILCRYLPNEAKLVGMKMTRFTALGNIVIYKICL